jgi:hypothetical protein
MRLPAKVSFVGVRLPILILGTEPQQYSPRGMVAPESLASLTRNGRLLLFRILTLTHRAHHGFCQVFHCAGVVCLEFVQYLDKSP